MNKKEFVKIGKEIFVVPKGNEYELIPNQVYNLEWDGWNERSIFKENGELNLPSTIYETKSDSIFRKRIINYFNTTTSNTTGVLLAGTKGTGKTVTAKLLAKESNLPIIIIDPKFPENKLINFFKTFETPVCILFDEIEKKFNTTKMLDFLDGVEKTAKKLIIMTCNDTSNISEYMEDRCSRVRYVRNYDANENVELLPIIADNLNIKNKEEVIKFCNDNICLLSIDNIIAFMQEVKSFEDEDISLQDIIQYLNISTKQYENMRNK